MNYSDEYKTILLLPMRQGTRAVFSPFSCLGFISDTENNKVTPTHKLEIPEGKSYYDIISTIRHPYKRYKSIIEWSSKINKNINKYTSHKEAFEDVSRIMDDYFTILRFNNEYGLKYTIDTENMADDILKIPCIKDNLQDSCLQHKLESTIYKNQFITENPKTPLTSEPLPDYIKEQIYSRYQEYFEIFNYQK